MSLGIAYRVSKSHRMYSGRQSECSEGYKYQMAILLSPSLKWEAFYEKKILAGDGMLARSAAGVS